MKYYYKLDQGETGKPLASYARNQPNIEGLQYLEELPDEYYEWNGSQWIEDVESYLKNKVLEIKNIITNRWLDSNTKPITAVQAKYKVFKNAFYSTRASVDVAFDNLITWLDLDE